jgi:hypothetical protein
LNDFIIELRRDEFSAEVGKQRPVRNAAVVKTETLVGGEVIGDTRAVLESGYLQIHAVSDERKGKYL